MHSAAHFYNERHLGLKIFTFIFFLFFFFMFHHICSALLLQLKGGDASLVPVAGPAARSRRSVRIDKPMHADGDRVGCLNVSHVTPHPHIVMYP